MKTRNQAIKSNAHDATAPPEVDPIDDEDDYFMDMQEAAELGILNNHRRYVSHRVRKHPFGQ